MAAYRRLAACGELRLERLARKLRHQASERLVGHPTRAPMPARPFEFYWPRPRPHRLLRSVWESPAVRIVASGLAGMFLLLAGKGH